MLKTYIYNVVMIFLKIRFSKVTCAYKFNFAFASKLKLIKLRYI